MKTVKQTVRLINRPLVAFAILTFFYTALIFTLPANRTTMETYNLTPLGYRIVYFSLILPSLAAWFAAFMGYARLREYAGSIRKTAEGPHFATLATGATWLAWSLPLGAILSVVLAGISNSWHGFLPAAAIISIYANLILALAAFSIIGGAARGLLSQAKLHFDNQANHFIMLLFVLAGVFYCFLTFRWFDLSNPGSTDNPYFMPIWLTLLTVSIPYLYAWFVGLLAAYEITLFSKNVRGVLYKHALRYLVAGLVVVIGSSVALQYINTADPRFGKIIFDERLLLAIIFSLLRALGFILLIVGALRLKKIEEV